MVSKSWVGGLASRAVFLMSSRVTDTVDKAGYTADTISGIKTLQGWYDQSTGLWDTTGWWNSANCMTVLADFAQLDSKDAKTLNIPSVLQNTYEQAQKTTVQATKVLTAGTLPVSSYTRITARSLLMKRGYDNFLDDYYDDEGWWALALTAAHDVGIVGLADEMDYLQAANVIFQDMEKGTSSCGGIYWSKVDNYTNAIANELYLSTAAHLANRMSSNKAAYTKIAQQQWNWFESSGLINSQNLINDGLDDQCKNNGQQTWSYNQGVILGGLVELYKLTNNATLLTVASNIASAAIVHLTDANGILRDGCEPNCGADGSQFKGVFLRNLKYLYAVAPQDAFRTFILANANSIWDNDRNGTSLGVTWAGPYAAATAGTQSSALDAIVAAVAVS